MKVLVKSAWGSDDPTKAAFAFLHALQRSETTERRNDPWRLWCSRRASS
jgi:hypothetical protein